MVSTIDCLRRYISTRRDLNSFKVSTNLLIEISIESALSGLAELFVSYLTVRVECE